MMPRTGWASCPVVPSMASMEVPVYGGDVCERENAADVLSDLQAWVGEPFDAAGRRYDGGKESVDRSGRI